MNAKPDASVPRIDRVFRAFVLILMLVALTSCQALGDLLVRPKATGSSGVAAADAAHVAAGAAATMPGLPTGSPGAGNVLDPDAIKAPGAAPVPAGGEATDAGRKTIMVSGVVKAPSSGERFVQAVSADVVSNATVTFIGTNGESIASTKTRSDGSFDISLSGWVPANNGFYIVEATKGLGPNKPGEDALRFRTIVKWADPNWLSCTNKNPGPPGVVINALTTALALEYALDSNLQTTANFELAIGKVNVSANALNATPAIPNHSDDEINKLAQDLTNFLTSNIDPVGSVGAIKPALTSLSTTQGFPGALVTITGSGFLPVSGGNTVKFGSAIAPVYLATTTKLIVGVPAGAASGNVTVTTNRGGTSNGLNFNVTAGVSVLVKTNNVLAPFYVSGAETVPQPGDRNVTVYPGTSQIVFSTGQAASFVVAADGTVDAGISNGALAGASGEVSFQTTTLNINPDGYAGNYVLNGGFMSSGITGNGTALVLKGLKAYQLNAGTIHLFDMSSSGTATSRGDWAMGGASLLKFLNTTLEVKAGGYTGSWSINGVTASAQTGTVTLKLPADSSGYVFNLLGTAFTFNISGTNAVTTTSSYATGGPSTLTLAMVSVEVDPKGFTGQWSIGNVTSGWVRDKQTVTLMKNFNYRLSFWPGNSYVAFGVDGNENITVQSAGGQAATNVVTVATNKINFNTTDLTITGGGWRGMYGVLYGSTPGSWTWMQPTQGDANWVIGDRTYKVLAGMASYYYLYFYPGTAEDYVNFNVASSGAVGSPSGSLRITKDVAAFGVAPAANSQTIQFNTHPVSIDTKGWSGYWGLLYGDGPSRGWAWLASDTGDPNWLIGDRVYKMLGGVNDYYYFNFWPGANGNYHAVMSIDKNGNVTDKASGPGAPVSEFALNTTLKKIEMAVEDVTINTNGWGGWYGMFYGASPQLGWTWLPTASNDPNWVFGNKTYKMVRGVQNYYQMWFYPGGTNYYLTLDFRPTVAQGGSDTLGIGLNGAFTTSAVLESAANKTIKFRTTDVTVSNNKWSGYYGILYGHGPQQGWSWLGDGSGNPNWVNTPSGTATRTFKLLQGMVDYYHFSYWPDPTKYRVVFNVDAGASPTISRRSSGSQSTKGALFLGAAPGTDTDSMQTTQLTVPTRTLTIDEGNWEGYWGFLYGAGPSLGWTWLTSPTGEPNWIKKTPSQPNSQFTMVKGLNNYFYLYFWPGGTGNYWLNVNLASNDTLTVTENGGPIHTSAVSPITQTSATPTLTFQTYKIKVDPNGFRGYWGILYGISANQGWTWVPATTGEAWWQFNNQAREFWLLKGIDRHYFVYFWPGAGDDFVQFDMNTSGSLSFVDKGARFGQSSVLYNNPATGQLKFNTSTLTINSNNWRGYHGMFYGNGPQQGWTWLNASNGEWWTIGNNTWSLIRDTKGYHQHIFWPVGANYYRAFDVDANGTVTTPDGGAPVTTSVYTASTFAGPNPTITLNTGKNYFYTNGYGGHTGLLYGISPQQGWTWLYDDAQAHWSKFPTSQYTNKSWTLLRGISNYYYLAFWPWNPYANFNVDGSGNVQFNSGGSQGLTIGNSVSSSGAQMYVHNCWVEMHGAGARWAMHYGDSQSKDWAFDENGSQDWVSSGVTRRWLIPKGMSNYWWWVVEGKTGYTPWSTYTDGNTSWGWTGAGFNGVAFYSRKSVTGNTGCN